MKLAVVGITGLVGREIVKVLDEHRFGMSMLIPVASPLSKGKKMVFRDREYTILDHEQAISLQPDMAIFSAGGKVSRDWAPR